MYVGEVTGVGEAFGLLSEMYYLPARYFDLTLEHFPGNVEAESDSRHLVAGRHGNRVGRLDEIGVDLLRRKISVMYTRGDPMSAPGLTY